jgi:Kef-type K+ transport system membrane component KefB
MTSVWALASLWLGLALVASLFSNWFRVSTALSEIIVGTVAQLIIGAVIGSAVLGTDKSWVKFLSGVGAILLTFLAAPNLIHRFSSSSGRKRSRLGSRASFFHFSDAQQRLIIS